MTLSELVSELETVTNWFVLGLHLGVPVDELRRINEEHFNTEYSRIMVLEAFMENAASEQNVWSEIVTALATMGEVQLAKTIAIKNS